LLFDNVPVPIQGIAVRIPMGGIESFDG
jgi:hypothetical protein